MSKSYVRAEGPGATFYDDNGQSQRRIAKIESESCAFSREDCKGRIAEMHRREARKTELRNAIAAVNIEIEKAAADHYSTCAPIQDELRSIDKLEIAGMLGGKVLKPAQEGRRRNLRSQIDELNTSLEEIASRCRGKLALLEEELAAAELDTTALGKLRNDLIQVWGDPEKLKRLRALHDVQQLLRPNENQLETLCNAIGISIQIAREKHESTVEAAEQLERATLRLGILRQASAGLFHEANRLLEKIKNDP